MFGPFVKTSTLLSPCIWIKSLSLRRACHRLAQWLEALVVDIIKGTSCRLAADSCTSEIKAQASSSSLIPKGRFLLRRIRLVQVYLQIMMSVSSISAFESFLIVFGKFESSDNLFAVSSHLSSCLSIEIISTSVRKASFEFCLCGLRYSLPVPVYGDDRIDTIAISCFEASVLKALIQPLCA